MQKNKIKYNINSTSLFIKTINYCISYKIHYVIFVVFAITIAFLYKKFTSPYFEAKAQLIIKDEKKGNEDSKLMESLNLISSKKIIENEIEVIKSRPILQRVVNKLHLYAPIYKSNLFGKFSGYEVSPIHIELINPEKIVSNTNNIKFKYNKFKNNIILDDSLIYPINSWIKTTFGTLRFVKKEILSNSFSYSHDSLFYFKLLNNESIINKISNNLKVTSTNKLSSIINLEYKDHTPRLSEDVLNEIIFSYNLFISNEKNNLAKSTLSFIDKRLLVIGQDLDSIENKVQLYKEGSNAVDISTQGQIFLENVSINDQQLSDLDNKIAVIQELDVMIDRNTFNNPISVGSFPSTLGILDPSITKLVENLNTFELEYDKLKKTVAENNPLIIAIIDQINNTKYKIRENISTYKRSLETSKLNLLNTNLNYNRLLKSIPIKEQNLLEISRDKEIKSNIYSFLLEKREESEIAYASTLTNNSTITPAFASSTPVSPNNLFILGSLIFTIIAIPMGIVSIKDNFSNSIQDRSDIEPFTNIPIIGEIIHNEPEDQKLLESGNHTPNYESFRKLRYALSSRGIGRKSKKLLITSSISGEGKSYISTNLALSFSDVGKKVILIDFDFKNATLTSFFQLNNEPGLTDYLSGNAEEYHIVNHLKEFNNIFFIPTGSFSNNTTNLLENGNITNLFKYLEDNFDLIIIDTSPFLHIADSMLLTSYSDLTMFIIKQGYSPKDIMNFYNNHINPEFFDNTVILYNGVTSFNNLINNKSTYSIKSINKVDKSDIKLLN